MRQARPAGVQPSEAELLPKRAIDRRVAELLGRKVSDVSGVTEAFLHEIVRALVNGDQVRLDGLGTLRVCAFEMKKPTVLRGCLNTGRVSEPAVVNVRRKFFVRFRKSTRLRDALWAKHGRLKARRIKMDKYGVDESVDGEDLEKKAAQGCPRCGATPARHGSVLVCPTHGTEPFEQKKE